MSHDIITIDDEDSIMCARCTFRNESNSRLCAVCSAPLRVHADEKPQSTSRVCQACTFANEGGALACSVCHMPLVDDVEGEAGGQVFVEDHVLGTGILSSSGDTRAVGEACANSLFCPPLYLPT